MNTRITLLTVLGLVALATAPAGSGADVFRSGSDGSYGPMDVTTNTTLDLPPDGIFHCTTISVAANRTLRFRRNALNTPVYLLATGLIDIRGTIDVSGTQGLIGVGGKGGPGGFDGGAPANGPGQRGGDGLGPGGGGYPLGNGGYGTAGRYQGGADTPGGTYGNSVIVPLIGGSGGAGYRQTGQNGLGDYGGGGGGGAIVIASDTQIEHWGEVVANGSNAQNSSGYGSGGAIRFVAPIVAGMGSGEAHGDGISGGGRLRVDALDRHRLAFINSPNGWDPAAKAQYTIGSFMHVFPLVRSRLDILEAAGTAIPEGQPSEVKVTLPVGAPTTQVVRVQGRDFTGVVPIRVVVTPDAAAPTRYDAEIDMGTGNPATVSVNVVIPAGMTSRISAWTR